jgi:hypothetical protein
MTTMKALRFDEYGPPSVLTLRELAVPELRPGQALVELHASAVNPSDVKNVAGAFHSPLARVPGRDYAGVVAIGDGWKGKEVWGSGPGLGVTRDGTHAQYVVVDLDSLSEKAGAPLDVGGGCRRDRVSRGMVGAGRRREDPGWRDRPGHRRRGGGRPSGHPDCALEGSARDRRRYPGQSVRRRRLHQRQKQGPRPSKRERGRTERASTSRSTASAARCSSRA